MNIPRLLACRTRIGVIAVFASACALCLVLVRAEAGSRASQATGYALSWHTIDGGGVMLSTDAGGIYELSGTIGQADTDRPLTGGPFELTSGFWFGQSPGDCVFDGVVNLLDFSRFAECATGPGATVGDTCGCQDADSDGDVDLHDFAGFQSGFSGS